MCDNEHSLGAHFYRHKRRKRRKRHLSPATGGVPHHTPCPDATGHVDPPESAVETPQQERLFRQSGGGSPTTGTPRRGVSFT